MNPLSRLYIQSISLDDETTKKAVERIIERKIGTKEVIVFLDGDKTNFDRTNLYVTDDRGIDRLQKNLRDVFMDLVKSKQLAFDLMKGIFVKNEIPTRRIIISKPVAAEEKKIEVIKKESSNEDLDVVKIFVEIQAY